MSRRSRLLAGAQELTRPSVPAEVQVDRLIAPPGVYHDHRAVMIEVGRLLPNPRNPRQVFDPVELGELASSIRAQGILNPITVRRHEERVGHYVVVAGDRRLRAAIMAGLAEAPCLIVDIKDEDDAYIKGLIENLQRANLTPAEEAAALAVLAKEKRLSVREIARLIHKSPTYVSDKVRLAQNAELLQAVREGVPVSAAERLLKIQDQERRRELLAAVREGRLTAHELAGTLGRSRRAPAPRGAEATTRQEVSEVLAPPAPAAAREDRTRQKVSELLTLSVEREAVPEQAPRETPAPVATAVARKAREFLEVLEQVTPAALDEATANQLRDLYQRLAALLGALESSTPSAGLPRSDG